MRPSVVLPLLVLAGCGNGSSAEALPGERISCALDGAADFRGQCSLERTATELVVHRPDGGFRRFGFAGAGSIEALDGADRVTVSVAADSSTELAIGGDRYRINLGNSHARQP